LSNTIKRVLFGPFCVGTGLKNMENAVSLLLVVVAFHATELVVTVLIMLTITASYQPGATILSCGDLTTISERQ
jgi:hypothetical protein